MKQIKDTHFYITKDGLVLNKKTGRWLKETKKSNGYMRYALNYESSVKFYYTHRLLGYAYLNLTDDKFIDHINNNRSDNRLSNLCVVSRIENNRKSNRLNFNLPDYISIKKAINGRSARYMFKYKNLQYSSIDLENVLMFKYSFEAI